jgi:hypothetical protein
VDASGKPVLGADGQPIQVPVNSTVNSSGAVIGPDGKPITKDLLVGGPFTSSALTAGGLLPGGGLLLGASGAGPGSVGTVSPGGPLGLPLTGAAAAGAEAAAFARTPSRLSMTAAEEAVAEQAQIIGRANVASSGPPFMPPMTAGPGATGGAAQKRRTWLEEDEEVWGTESTALPGVIGKRSDGT